MAPGRLTPMVLLSKQALGLPFLQETQVPQF
jgi:hypothetical protein